MAFGLLTLEFQILEKPLQVKVANAGKVHVPDLCNTSQFHYK
jgi:hypothetical protein